MENFKNGYSENVEVKNNTKETEKGGEERMMKKYEERKREHEEMKKQMRKEREEMDRELEKQLGEMEKSNGEPAKAEPLEKKLGEGERYSEQDEKRLYEIRREKLEKLSKVKMERRQIPPSRRKASRELVNNITSKSPEEIKELIPQLEKTIENKWKQLIERIPDLLIFAREEPENAISSIWQSRDEITDDPAIHDIKKFLDLKSISKRFENPTIQYVEKLASLNDDEFSAALDTADPTIKSDFEHLVKEIKKEIPAILDYARENPDSATRLLTRIMNVFERTISIAEIYKK